MDSGEKLAEDFDYSHYYDYANDSLSLIKPIEEEGLQIAGSITAVFYSLITGISVAGNSFLLWVLIQQKGLSSPANLFLLHLTISNVLFTLTLVPWAVYQVQGWLFGKTACKLFSGTIFLGLYSYMLLLTCMTVHRYIVVVHAVRSTSQGTRRAKICTHLTCAFVWLFSAGWSLPEILFSDTMNGPNGVVCLLEQSPKMKLTSYYVQISVFFLLPFVVITFCYARIVMTIRRCQIRKMQHTLWLIFCIVVGFFICWAPYNVTIFIHSLQLLEVQSLATYAWEKRLAYSYYITHIMAYCHCCLKPLIQIFGGVKFRSYLPQSRFSRDRSYTFTSQNAHHLTSDAL